MRGECLPSPGISLYNGSETGGVPRSAFRCTMSPRTGGRPVTEALACSYIGRCLHPDDYERRDGVVADRTLDMLFDTVRDLATAVYNLRQEVNAGFQRMQGEFENVNGELAQVKGELTQFKEELEQLKRELAQLKGEFQEMRSELRQMNERLDRIEKRLAKLEGESNHAKIRLFDVERELEEIKRLHL